MKTTATLVTIEDSAGALAEYARFCGVATWPDQSAGTIARSSDSVAVLEADEVTATLVEN